MDLSNQTIVHIKKDNIEYLQFKRLLDHQNIKHAYVLKPHGLNFRLGTNFHNKEVVLNSLRTFCKECDFDFNSVVRPDFEHTSNVKVIDHIDDTYSTPEIYGQRFKEVDGLITNTKDITLMATNADCSIIILYDAKKNVIGNIHAGWRGTFGKIALNAINKMKDEFGCIPKDIEAYFCPSIRKCHFEVDEDLAKRCEELFGYTGKLDEIVFLGDIKEEKQKYYIDTVLINKLLLKEAGLVDENIIDCEICSMCRNDLVHSRRSEGEYFGVGASFISLV